LSAGVPSDATDALFNFYISAKGMFYIDCGTGGVLSGTVTSTPPAGWDPQAAAAAAQNAG